MKTRRSERFAEALNERVLLLDGAMGTMLLGYGLREEDYRGEEFAEHNMPLKGNLDLLTLVRPDLIETVHRAYLNAGADIISTNTFGANAIRQGKCGTAHLVERMNREAAEIARRVIDDFRAVDPDREMWVAGVMGPADTGEGLARDELQRVYAEQARGLLQGGADVILIEMVMIVAGAVAACEGARAAFEEVGAEAPLWVCATTDENGERMMSGEGFEALVNAVEPFGVAVIGMNCGYGPESIGRAVRVMVGLTEVPISAHPSAGLPDEIGVYPVGPEMFGEWAAGMVETALVRIVGGCCGTTPEHVRGMRRGIGSGER